MTRVAVRHRPVIAAVRHRPVIFVVLSCLVLALAGAGAYALLRKHNEPLPEVVVYPGFTLAQVAARVGTVPGHSASDFLRLARSGAVRSPYQPGSIHTLAGMLTPGIYDVGPRETNLDLLEQMVGRFDAMARRAGLASAPGAVGKTPYQALVVASLVQREAGLPADRARVARVVYNRLAAGMRLQLDSTVAYAIGCSCRLSLADLKVRSPYNTYLVHGLPPTPISTVSAADIEAALHPATGPWLYFVVVGKDGEEAFSATYAGQLANAHLAEERGLGA